MSKSIVGNGQSGPTSIVNPGPLSPIKSAIAGPVPRTEMIEIEPRHRLRQSGGTCCHLLALRDGIVAIESMPAGGRRQILDFLLPGDVVPCSIVLAQPVIFLRAVTKASLEQVVVDGGGDDADHAMQVPGVLDHMRSHLERRNLHQIMIGQLDSEARVATFLLVLGLRTHGLLDKGVKLALPMSRDDIADYLTINPDTLSRIMMRMETLGLIRRLNRHAIVLEDIEGLCQHTPLRIQFLAGSAGLTRNGA